MTKAQTEVMQISLAGRGAEVVSDEDPLQLEEDCGELGDHPPDGEKDPEALFRSLDEAWDEPSLEASDDEASVDDAIDVALNDMDGAAPSPNGDLTHMDVACLSDASWPRDIPILPHECSGRVRF